MLTGWVDRCSSLSGKNVPRALEGTPGGSPCLPRPSSSKPATERWACLSPQSPEYRTRGRRPRERDLRWPRTQAAPVRKYFAVQCGGLKRVCAGEHRAAEARSTRWAAFLGDPRSSGRIEGEIHRTYGKLLKAKRSALKFMWEKRNGGNLRRRGVTPRKNPPGPASGGATDRRDPQPSVAGPSRHRAVAGGH